MYRSGLTDLPLYRHCTVGTGLDLSDLMVWLILCATGLDLSTKGSQVRVPRPVSNEVRDSLQNKVTLFSGSTPQHLNNSTSLHQLRIQLDGNGFEGFRYRAVYLGAISNFQEFVFIDAGYLALRF